MLLLHTRHKVATWKLSAKAKGKVRLPRSTRAQRAPSPCLLLSGSSPGSRPNSITFFRGPATASLSLLPGRSLHHIIPAGSLATDISFPRLVRGPPPHHSPKGQASMPHIPRPRKTFQHSPGQHCWHSGREGAGQCSYYQVRTGGTSSTPDSPGKDSCWWPPPLGGVSVLPPTLSAKEGSGHPKHKEGPVGQKHPSTPSATQRR